MQTKSISLRFKPIRIGWCVKQGDLIGLKTALELSHTVWGGKYNPIIPVGNLELQAPLVRRFHVDILFPISECDEVNEFIEQYTYLKSPFELDEIFGKDERSRPNFLDIYHPCRHIHEQFSGKEMPFRPRLLAWQNDDPLALALLASVGSYPSKSEQYFRFFEQLPKYRKVDLTQTADLPPTLYQYFSPSELTTYRTEFSLGSRGDLAGFYVGDSGSSDDLVEYMLKKKVFQAGLEIKCPNCLLKFWLSIDDVKSHVNCSYCDHQFNITPMLKDRDWRFRRSGLFSMDDQGSVPVALLLQQMDTVFQSLYYSTSMNLQPDSADINRCEIDFFIIASPRKHWKAKQQIAFGECKTTNLIERQDIENLVKVRDALKHQELDIFILFSKLAPFTEDEIQLCKSIQPKYERRVIMLTDQELEPYFMYERTPKETGIERYALDFEDMAENTHTLYFQPLTKGA